MLPFLLYKRLPLSFGATTLYTSAYLPNTIVIQPKINYTCLLRY